MGHPGAFAVIAQRYELRQELGRGAGGVVYSARDRASGLDVALKLTRAAAIAGGAPSDALAHEHILCVHARGIDGAVAYTVTEHIGGADLTRHCDRPSLLP